MFKLPNVATFLTSIPWIRSKNQIHTLSSLCKHKKSVDSSKCHPEIPVTSCNVTEEGVPDIHLNDGNKIPILGLGTWNSPPRMVYKAVQIAIKAGYRHIDCAYFYGNEPEVGRAISKMIKEKIVKRKELFITSKLWNTFHSPELVSHAIQASLKNLTLSYLDLYLMHWPMGFRENRELLPLDACKRVLCSRVDYVDTWKGMEGIVKERLARSIGVANFNKRQIKRILKIAKIKPVINQVECHPFLNQKKLIKFCKSKDIAVIGYSPLGSPGQLTGSAKKKKHLLTNKKIASIAYQHKRAPAQILLRYQIQRGIIVIPKSVLKDRILCNFNVFNFELTPAEMRIINGMNENFRILHRKNLRNHPHYPFSDPY